MPKTPGQRGLSLIVLVVVLAACHGSTSHPGSDADRVACTLLGNTLSLTKGQVNPAILVADYRTTQKAAERADDAKLRASIVSLTRYAIEGAVKVPNPDPTYATVRCRQLGAALPVNFAVSPIHLLESN